MTLLSGDIPKIYRPGLKKVQGEYDAMTKYSEMIFDVVKSDKNYEEYLIVNDMGNFPVKTEGSAVSYDNISQGAVTRITNVPYAKAFAITREAIDDALALDVFTRSARALARAAYRTTETNAANILNNGSTDAIGADGKALLATDHPTISGDQSNELAVSASISEGSLEDLCILARRMKNDSGMPLDIMTEMLIGAPEQEFEFERLTKSAQQAATANNDINAIRSTRRFPKGYLINPYLTDTNAFFIKTSGYSGEGLVYQKRVEKEVSKEKDFQTDNQEFKMYFREAFLWVDWRAIVGSPGAS